MEVFNNQMRGSIKIGNNGDVRVLEAIRTEYHEINTSIKLKVSLLKPKNAPLFGHYVILNSHRLVKKGKLIELRFNLGYTPRHKFGTSNQLLEPCEYIGIGQVVDTLECRLQKYKILVRLLEIKRSPQSKPTTNEY